MDDTEKPDPPHSSEVEALREQLPGAAAPADDTLPARPAPDHHTGQGLPPPEGAQAGKVMPAPPDTMHAPTRPGAQEGSDEPGLQRAILDSNLDAIAQSNPNASADRYGPEALLEMVRGGTIPVPANGIDRALIEIWKSTTSGGDFEGKIAITLMRAMNLVVYVEDDTRAAQVNEVIGRIVGRHPCRTLMIVNSGDHGPGAGGARGTAEGDLQALMSAHCQIADASGKQVCCEELTVRASNPDALSRVSNIVLNLLITDLPVFLWWAGGVPFNNPVLTHLEDSIDRLLFDSAAFNDPVTGLLALARALDPATRSADTVRYAPGDFNWDRLSGWREATAQFFDAPPFTASLGRIGSVELQYAAPPAGADPNPVQALLYAAWLGTRLRWEFHSASSGRGDSGDVVLTMRQGTRSIPIALRAVAVEAESAGALVTVRMLTNDVRPITFSTKLAGDNVFMDCLVEQDGMEPVARKVRYTVPDEIGLLDTEMELFGHDPVYEQALAMAGTMAWSSLSLRKRAELSAQLGAEQRQSSFDPRF